MNSVVIIDEAHNLLETISGIHSTTISGTQLAVAYSQLSQYKTKYKTRLKASNLLYIKQISYILASFIKYLGGAPGKGPQEPTTFKKEETKLTNVSAFLCDTDTYNQNLLKLVKYCHVSQIAHKLQGFVEKYKDGAEADKPQKGVGAFLDSLQTKKDQQEQPVNTEVKSENRKPGSSPLLGIVEFLATLATNFADSRIVVKFDTKLAGSSIRFLLLDPASQFKEIVEDAHSVIVAGGTMRPIEEFKQQLFIAAGADPDRISHFSCEHVVPGEHLHPAVVTTGPTGVQLDFSYQHRDTQKSSRRAGPRATERSVRDSRRHCRLLPVLRLRRESVQASGKGSVPTENLPQKISFPRTARQWRWGQNPAGLLQSSQVKEGRGRHAVRRGGRQNVRGNQFQ